MADNFSVIGQMHRTTLQPNGQFLPVVVVSFKIPSGATNQVEIPQSQYTADYVRSQIEPLAAEMIAVESL